MTKQQNTLAAATLLLMLGGSSVAASAQTTLPINEYCPIRNAPPRPLTFYPAEPPAPAPNYTLNGTAIVRFEISAAGTPQNATIEKSSGSKLLDRAAMKTVVEQRFAPEIRDCVPIAGSYLYEVDY